jgi:hypothetical protein
MRASVSGSIVLTWSMLQPQVGDGNSRFTAFPDVGAGDVIRLVEAVLHQLPAVARHLPHRLVVLVAERHGALERPVHDVLADAAGLHEIVRRRSGHRLSSTSVSFGFPGFPSTRGPV